MCVCVCVRESHRQQKEIEFKESIVMCSEAAAIMNVVLYTKRPQPASHHIILYTHLKLHTIYLYLATYSYSAHGTHRTS